MRYAAIGVPVATVWSSPGAPGDGDGPALGAEPDVPAWTAALGHEQRLSLAGRVVTQALWGDLVLVLQEQAGWARVLLPDQPTSLDARGYPGWIPSAQLSGSTPAASAERYVVAVPAARAGVAGARTAVDVSFGTNVCFPDPARETPAGEGPAGEGPAGEGPAGEGPARETPDREGPVRADYVWAATGSGHRLRLPAGALAPAPQYAPCGQALVDSAMSFMGLAYLWGGVSGFGFDCSGLAWSVLRRHGIIAPRDAHDQAESGQPVSPGALEPGDLVFFAERPGGHVHHVGMALGDGRMVHSPRTGRPVEVTPLTAGPYARELVTARRYR